ncbi:MAG: DNA modification methylase [Methanobacteriota archaeon]|jgi:DNA modification methylase
MKTEHRVLYDDARSMDAVDDDSVELVVTSPPYPMIGMWDETFASMSDEACEALEEGEGERAYEAMHAQLDAVWDEVDRVLAPGGTVCVNVGDATRKVDDGFRVYTNHERVTRAFEERGFRSLPGVVWRKPANSAAKFMGSGMMPPNAYVTLEHEHILVLRKGERSFDDDARERRYESAYFWEERNDWFSDLWRVRGERQALDGDARDRSAAFPFEIPYRLVNMYSVYGDTVLDPFLGTGTTTAAVVCSARNSVGYEIDGDFGDAVASTVGKTPGLSRRVTAERLEAHAGFVEERGAEAFGYTSERYGFPVMTAQEEDILLRNVEDIETTEDGYVAHHTVAEASGEVERPQTTLGSHET